MLSFLINGSCEFSHAPFKFSIAACSQSFHSSCSFLMTCLSDAVTVSSASGGQSSSPVMMSHRYFDCKADFMWLDHDEQFEPFSFGNLKALDNTKLSRSVAGLIT